MPEADLPLSAACPSGRYGAACRLECSCLNNGTCEPTTGACRCSPGFYGQACEHRECWGPWPGTPLPACVGVWAHLGSGGLGDWPNPRLLG